MSSHNPQHDQPPVQVPPPQGQPPVQVPPPQGQPPVQVPLPQGYPLQANPSPLQPPQPQGYGYYPQGNPSQMLMQSPQLQGFPVVYALQPQPQGDPPSSPFKNKKEDRDCKCCRAWKSDGAIIDGSWN